MKQSIVIILFLGVTLSLAGQKSRVMAVKQMMDTEKYQDAKDAIELAVWNDKTSKWPRTYYTKGLLCQTAFEAGIEKNDSKLTSLYPDQLIVAYDSYEKALELDARERLHTIIRQKYYLLSNDFRSQGEKHYKKREYKEALRAFEHAIQIGESDLISTKTDTNLVFNAAMAAYEGENWETASKYLNILHENAYSSTASLLLSMAVFNAGDTVRSEEVLVEGMELYHYDDSLVMYMVNQLVISDRSETAIEILDSAIQVRSENHMFYWASGLVHRRMGNYEKAIASFLKADELAPDNPTLYYHMGVCYYNMGIDLRESALNISEKEKYREIREQFLGQFREAVNWMERSYKLDPQNDETISILYQLYYQLQMKEEQETFQRLISD